MTPWNQFAHPEIQKARLDETQPSAVDTPQGVLEHIPQRQESFER